MFPIYFVIGLINIFSQHHNYGIDIKDPEFDIRVRRSIGEDAKQQVFNLHNNEETNLNREKRNAYYEKTRITNNDIQKYSNGNQNNGNQSARNNGKRYDIFNPNWNFLFNKTRKTRDGDNSRVNNNRPIINSYPHGYPPGYGPKNSATGSDRITTTTGYRNQDSNTPYYYNFQNPDEQNFAGYAGYAPNVSGVTPGSRYSTRANNTNNAWNNVLAPYPPTNMEKPLTYIPTNNLPASYPPTNTQKPLTYISTKKLPATYSTTNNQGVHKLPYATNSVNRNYKNNFNRVPKPFVKDNLSQYAPNFNNGTSTFANGSINFNNGLANWNNGSTDFDNTNTKVTTTEKILSSCVICNIPCPQFMRRFGRFCMPEDVD